MASKSTAKKAQGSSSVKSAGKNAVKSKSPAKPANSGKGAVSKSTEAVKPRGAVKPAGKSSKKAAPAKSAGAKSVVAVKTATKAAKGASASGGARKVAAGKPDAKAKVSTVLPVTKTVAKAGKADVAGKSGQKKSGKAEGKVAGGVKVKGASKAEKPVVVEVPEAEVKREFARPSPSAVRRAKEKEKGTVKSPFSHTDHDSVFKGVEARKAAARAKQARMDTKFAKPKKGVARRLTDKQLGEFEDMLLRIRAELLRQIAYLRGASLQRFDEVNPEEDGTDAFERQLALKLAAGEGDSIFEIDEAMDRIQQKTYGVCEECGCIIPAQRLQALPFARRCVECQSRLEQGPSVSEHRYF